MALREQRELLNLQLAEQREEASHAREIDAIATLIATVTRLRLEYKELSAPEMQERFVEMYSATLRWAFEVPRESAAAALKKWPFVLIRLATLAQVGTKNGGAGDTVPESIFVDESVLFEMHISDWPNASPKKKMMIVERLNQQRERLAPVLAAFEE